MTIRGTVLALDYAWGMGMPGQRSIRAILGLWLVLTGSAVRAAEGPVCTSYTVTASVIKSSGGQRYLDVNMAVQDGEYAKICFKNAGADIYLDPDKGPQLHIHNTLGKLLLIENLVVKQTAVPSCAAGALTCPSVIVTGSSPVILRNLRMLNTNAQAAVDGLSIRTGDVAVEVTPDKASDPAYATAENFRYGIVVESVDGSSVHDTTLQGVKLRRQSVLEGSAGIRSFGGVGLDIIDADVGGFATGIALVGGTAMAPNRVRGGNLHGGSTAHTGVLLQGSHALALGTAEHPLTIVQYQHGVWIDPTTDGPVGITGGAILETNIGVKITANGSATTALALHPASFYKVGTLFAAEKPFGTALANLPIAKQCAESSDMMANDTVYTICDAGAETAETNAVTTVIGMLPPEVCQASNTSVVLYIDTKALAGQDPTFATQTFLGQCAVGLTSAAHALIAIDANQTVDMTPLPAGTCHFRCEHDAQNAPLSIPLMKSVVWPVLVTGEGAYPLAAGLPVASLQDLYASPGVATMTPIESPEVSGGGAGAGLDQLTGESAAAGLAEGVLGGGVLAGDAGTIPVAPFDAGGGTAHDADAHAVPSDDGTTTVAAGGGPVLAGGGLNGSPTDGGPGIAGVGGGCSLLVPR